MADGGREHDPEEDGGGEEGGRGDASGVHTHTRAFGNRLVGVHITSAKHIQVGDHNTMVIGQGKGRGRGRGSDPKDINITKPMTKLTSKQMDTVSHAVADDWHELAIELGLQKGEIEHIDMDVGQSYGYEQSHNYEKAFQAIKKWQKQNASTATVHALAQHLVKIDRADIAENL
ncbi:hypothetical protein ScPMuIL_005431 [Solemya velum]